MADIACMADGREGKRVFKAGMPQFFLVPSSSNVSHASSGDLGMMNILTDKHLSLTLKIRLYCNLPIQY